MSLYDTLGVSRDADTKEIKRAWMDLSKKHHPDKGGDVEQFKKVQAAYEVLNDDDKRAHYNLTGNTENQQGPQGFPFGGMPGMPGMHFGMPGMPHGVPVNISEMFGNMFMHGMPGMPQHVPKKQARRPKGPNKMHEIPLSIHDFYHGKSIRFDLERHVFCEACSGEGCTNLQTCNDCRGSGMRETMMQIGPGMMAVNRSPCNSCGAQGKTRGSNCEPCSGKGLVIKAKVLQVDIKKGANVGDVIIFEESCSDHPDFEKSGDVLIRLTAATEELDIVREVSALRYECTVSLSESLLGCTRTVKGHPGFPNGLPVNIPASTQNNEIVCVKGSGMPVNDGFGDLFVRVFVKVTDAEKDVLQKNAGALAAMFS